MVLRAVTLDDKYGLDKGRIYLTGTQALVRLPMMQRQRDILAGLTIRRAPIKPIEFPEQSPLRIDSEFDPQVYPDATTVVTAREQPASVTDRTTNILEHKIGR